MATVVTPMEPAAADSHAMRVLPIVADLMPPEIVDARRARRARRAVLSAVSAFAVLLCGWYGVVTYQTAVARDELARATAEAQNLHRQQQQYGEVTKLQSESLGISSQLSGVLANDVRWSRLLMALRTVAPSGLTITSASATIGPSGAGAAAPVPPAAPGQRAIGSIEVSGNAPSKSAVASYIEKLATVPGLANVLLNSVTDEDSGVHFSVRVDLTAAALGGRYTPQQGKGGK